MEQTLELNAAESWFGDALRVVDAPEDTPYLEGVPAFAHSSKTYFGGLAMVDTALRGQLHLKFFPPGSNGRARFELRQPGMLMEADASLGEPQLFKQPMQLCRVMDVPDLVSWGELVYRFRGDLYISYPTGLLWPKPVEPGGFPAKDGSFLVPFMRLRGATPLSYPNGFRGNAREVITTINERISYRFSLPGDPAKGEATFEFHHHGLDASCHLVELVWIAYFNAQEGSAEPDSVALTAVGAWSRDPDGKLRFLSAFMTEAVGESYFDILIDGGATTCAHFRPTLEDSMP